MNKIKYSLLVIFLLLISYSYSQTNDSSSTSQTNTGNTVEPASEFRPFRIGVYGDLGASWMVPKNDYYIKNGSKISAGWGLLFDWNFTENYTFSSGFYLGNFGGKLKYNHKLPDANNVIGLMERKYNIKYLDIPLNLKLKTNQIGYFTYFFQIGINNGFRLSATADDIFTSTTDPKESYAKDKIDIIGSTSLYRLSFNVGAGAEYQISKSFSAFAYLGYNNGLLNSLSGQNSVDPNVKENAIINKLSLTAGFLF